MIFSWKKTAIAFTLALSALSLNSCGKSTSDKSVGSSASPDLEESVSEQKVPEKKAQAKADNNQDLLLGKWQIVKLVENGQEVSLEEILAEIAETGDAESAEETAQGMTGEFAEDGKFRLAEEEGTYQVEGDTLILQDLTKEEPINLNFRVSETELVAYNAQEEENKVEVYFKRLE
ncbi:MAG: lipocalin family protein [Spirulinaceae cyanobacterium]